MSEEQILLTNMLLYIATIPLFVKRCGWLNIATVAWMFYVVCAICGYFYYKSPVYYLSFSAWEYIQEPAMWYLYAMNLMLCYMLRVFEFPKADRIRCYDPEMVRRVQYVLNLFFAIITVLSLPGAIANLTSGNLGAARDMTYEEGANGAVGGILSYGSRLLGPTVNMLLMIPAFHGLIVKRFERIDMVSLIIFAANLIVGIGAWVSRGLMVVCGVYVMIMMLFSRSYLSAKVVKWSVIIGAPVVLVAMSLFSSITDSRFGKDGANYESDTKYANLRYAGESQLDFMSMMYDKTLEPMYGYKQLVLFRKALGLSYHGESKSPDIEKNLEPHDRVHPYPNYIFYTAVGTLYMEWGKWPPLVALVLINIWLAILRRRIRGQLNFFNFILGAYLGYLVIYGIFYLEYCSEGGNSLMVLLLIWYMMLRRHTTPLKPASAA